MELCKINQFRNRVNSVSISRTDLSSHCGYVIHYNLAIIPRDFV
jgi:hypothetical protein